MIPVRGQILNVSETLQAFGGIPSLLRQAGMGAMTQSLQLVSQTVRDKFLQGPYPTEIERRSGSFRATFQRGHPLNIHQVTASGTFMLGVLGSNDRRAKMLNDGGTILPVRSQFLAIRTEFTKTPQGVVRAKYQAPLRTVANTFVHMRDANHGTVFEKVGRRIVPIAWLVRSVTIKGRHYLDKTKAVVEPLIPQIFQARFDAVLTQLDTTLRRLRGAR